MYFLYSATQAQCHRELIYSIIFFKFCGDKSPLCGTTGALCFRLWLTAHRFQSQGGSTIACTLLVHNDPQSQLLIPRPGPGPNFTPWYGEATARVTAQCHFRHGWQIRTHNLTIRSPTFYIDVWHISIIILVGLSLIERPILISP